MRDYIVSGVPLRDPLGEWGIDYTASTLVSDVSRTILDGSIFGFHGGAPDPENYFGTGRESLVMNVLGDDKDDHKMILTGLLGLFGRKDFTVLSAPQRTPLAGGLARAGQSFTVDPSLLRTAQFRQVGSAGIERINERTARVTFVLENINAFYRSVSDYTTASIPITAASQAVDLTALLGDSNAPITAGLVRVKGPLAVSGLLKVQDSVSGKSVGLRPTVALAATEYVVIDMATLKANKNTTDSWAQTGGADWSARVDLGGEGAFVFDSGAPAGTWPAGGFVYGGTIAATGFTSGTTAMDFRLKRSYTT